MHSGHRVAKKIFKLLIPTHCKTYSHQGKCKFYKDWPNLSLKTLKKWCTKIACIRRLTHKRKILLHKKGELHSLYLTATWNYTGYIDTKMYLHIWEWKKITFYITEHYGTLSFLGNCKFIFIEKIRFFWKFLEFFWYFHGFLDKFCEIFQAVIWTPNYV